MAGNLSLVLMTFPQRWDPLTATLHAQLMVIPSVSPVDDPLLGGTSPIFADHVPSFQAIVIPNLAAFPTTTDATALAIPPVIVDPNPVVATRPNYMLLATDASKAGVTVTGTGALPTPPPPFTIRKALPQSYIDATGAAPGGATAGADEFGCAIRTQPVYKAGPKPTTLGWGPVISYALRQPILGSKLGLRYEIKVPLRNATLLNGGGWLFITLAASDAWAAGLTVAPPRPIRLYAARLPQLTTARQLFAAVLFPVDAVGAIDDTILPVAEAYDDGFAQIVHVNEPDANNAVTGEATSMTAPSAIGIQIGWDDEQVVAWQNGQINLMTAKMSGNLDAQTPLGVLGYRIDVADITSSPPTPTWHSLVVADVTLPHNFGTFKGDLTVEPTPLRPQDPSTSAISGDAWLPRYFANWRGGSLAAADQVLPAMLATSKSGFTATPDPVGILLSYGRTYQFRVRLADLSSGGPLVSDAPVNLDPADTATIDFKRTVPPKQPGIKVNFPAGTTTTYGSWPPPNYVIPEPQSLTFTRPLMGYPEVLYTNLGNTDANRGKIVEHFVATSNPGSGTVVGLPDPDAQTLEITVEIRTPAHDVAGGGTLDAPFRLLYTTTRAFPALPPGPLPTDPGLTVNVAYVDAPTIAFWDLNQPSGGPLCIPRARDVRITARALTRKDPTYFDNAATQGLSSKIVVRAELRSEPALLIRPIDGSPPLRAFLFKRPPGIDAPPVATQLAQALNVVCDGLLFAAPPGERIAFGASKAVRHTLSGDNSTIAFAAESELLRQWIVALVVDMPRDWTWDGLANNDTIAVLRDGGTVGGIQVVPTLGSAATADPAHWDRSRTRIVFFDGIDPHETTASGFPEEVKHVWQLQAKLHNEIGTVIGVTGSPKLDPGTPPSGAELNDVNQTITLPIAVPPAQTPEVASVGLALTPFEAAPGYVSTGARSKALWFEFKAPLANRAGDAYFARVLGHGPDPLLYSGLPNDAQPQEPPLNLDPELMRMITPGQSDDRAGLDAMTMLQPASDSNVHFLLPLPPGIDPTDPELFGFYTYEFRVGHAGDPHAGKWWSTAQARFGRPLRVTGVQHPAPPLVCTAGRIRSLPTNGAGPSPSVPNEISAIVERNVTVLEARAKTVAVHDFTRLSTYVLATATYATPVLDGHPLVRHTEYPKTLLYFFLYAQVVQADAVSNRNVLLFQRPGIFFGGEQTRGAGPDTLPIFRPTSQRDRVGGTAFTEVEIEDALAQLALPVDLPLSVLAVEFLPGAALQGDRNAPDPLDLDTRPRRILRVSPLTPVAAIC